MPNLNQKYKLSAQVVSTELDPTEAVLLHLENHNYYTLNETGWFVWKLIEQELDIREIANKIREEFDVEAERAEQCVLELIEQLHQENLVEMISN